MDDNSYIKDAQTLLSGLIELQDKVENAEIKKFINDGMEVLVKTIVIAKLENIAFTEVNLMKNASKIVEQISQLGE